MHNYQKVLLELKKGWFSPEECREMGLGMLRNHIKYLRKKGHAIRRKEGTWEYTYVGNTSYENKRLKDIIQTVQLVTNIHRNKLKGNRKKKEIVDARQVFSLLASECEFGLSEIGRYINKDHSTIKNLIEGRPITNELQQTLNKCRQLLGLDEGNVLKLAKEFIFNPEDNKIRTKLKSAL